MFEARFPNFSVPPRDAEYYRLEFYRNKFASSSDSLENHCLVGWRTGVLARRVWHTAMAGGNARPS
jgi:hypothetical protein